MITKLLPAAMVLLGLGTPALADVVDAGANGFSVKIAAEVNAPPASVFRALSEQIGRWWDPAHTFSGQAANLTIDLRAGGCFCEKVPTGSVQHMVVSHLEAPRMLILQGGLGPLGTLGVAGAMTWTLEARNGRTELQMVYNVGGYMQGGFTQLAPVVDGVLATQVRRLKVYVETGRPE